MIVNKQNYSRFILNNDDKSFLDKIARERMAIIYKETLETSHISNIQCPPWFEGFSSNFLEKQDMKELAENCLNEPVKCKTVEAKNIYGFCVAYFVFFNNIHFKNCYFKFCDFESGIIFQNCEFEECVFEHCTFGNVNFNSTKFTNSKFLYTKLLHINLSDSLIINSEFITSSLEDPFVHGFVSFEGTEFYNGCYVAGHDISHISNMKNCCRTLPEEGSFIAWKGAYTTNYKRVIVKLKVPDEALRTMTMGTRKGRCSAAKVIDIQSLNGKQHYKNVECMSWYDNKFRYKLGDTIHPEKNFNADGYVVCESGIHFFLNRDDAVAFSNEYLIRY